MVATILLASSYLAQQPPVGVELETLLKQAKLSYTDSGGFFNLRYNLADTKRSHKVMVRKELYTYNTLNGWEGFGLVYESETAPTLEQSLAWSQKRFSYGGLVFERPSEAQKLYRVRFRISIPANLPPEELQTHLSIVANTADQLELEISGKDIL